ncbi:MAG TPA: hypothetical protein VN086_02820 [Candidatus Paceibacterota bacterium]|nr:hypothetical protein [Candidatus Paceibacterota bacterium]
MEEPFRKEVNYGTEASVATTHGTAPAPPSRTLSSFSIARDT